MQDNTFIKVYRKIIDWEWYTDIPTCHLFRHFIIKANHTDWSWRGIEIKRGEYLTGRKRLAQETWLTEQQIRTSINKLKKTGELVATPTNQYTIYRLNNYDTYNQQPNQRATNEQPTSNHKQEELRRKKKEKEIILSIESERDFENFWTTYDKKVDKQRCERKWRNLLKEEKEKILQVVPKYILLKPDPQYRKNPLTWLNGKCWNDEIPVEKKKEEKKVVLTAIF